MSNHVDTGKIGEANLSDLFLNQKSMDLGAIQSHLDGTFDI